MTTDRKPEPRVKLTGLEWKLVLTAVLGATFAGSWLAIAGVSEAPRSPDATADKRRDRASSAVARASRPRTTNRIRTRSS